MKSFVHLSWKILSNTSGISEIFRLKCAELGEQDL